jgi:hypothetical protein
MGSWTIFRERSPESKACACRTSAVLSTPGGDPRYGQPKVTVLNVCEPGGSDDDAILFSEGVTVPGGTCPG